MSPAIEPNAIATHNGARVKVTSILSLPDGDLATIVPDPMHADEWQADADALRVPIADLAPVTETDDDLRARLAKLNARLLVAPRGRGGDGLQPLRDERFAILHELERRGAQATTSTATYTVGAILRLPAFRPCRLVRVDAIELHADGGPLRLEVTDLPHRASDAGTWGGDRRKVWVDDLSKWADAGHPTEVVAEGELLADAVTRITQSTDKSGRVSYPSTRDGATHAANADGLPACGATVTKRQEKLERFDPWNQRYLAAETVSSVYVPSFRAVDCKRCAKRASENR